MTYTSTVETKTGRWTLRVTPTQDAILRRVLDSTGESLNEYVVRHAVNAAQDDLAGRRTFALDDEQWTDIQELLDRPPNYKPELVELLERPSVLDQSE